MIGTLFILSLLMWAVALYILHKKLTFAKWGWKAVGWYCVLMSAYNVGYFGVLLMSKA